MKISSIFAIAAFVSTSALAGPADYVYTPTVEFGEREIDFKMGSASYADGTHRTDTSLGYGYGATEYSLLPSLMLLPSAFALPANAAP